MPHTPQLALSDPNVVEATARGFIELREQRIRYNLNQKKEYNWNDPEEWVRIRTLAFLIIIKGYPANRIRTEVNVPRRTPNDWADIVVYSDDRCTEPYLIVENKAAGQTAANRHQAIEQLFGNANSLRARLGLYDEWEESTFFNVADYPPTERIANIRGNRTAVPEQYGEIPAFTLFAGEEQDIRPVRAPVLESKIRRSHSIIWAGGKRDPLHAFDEWSKLLFAKVIDERNTPTGHARRFQVGTNETITAVANRVHFLFARGCEDDPTIFPANTRIELTDKKIYEVVGVLQEVSLMGTDVDNVGSAFENFFGSIFRGELGQYFTMRQIARFTVSVLNISHEHFIIDPTAGSGGFLLEALLQVWHKVDTQFRGQAVDQVIRIKNDFALLRVYGIEIHAILSRICKINLLLHHDGHTNIEGDRSCLDNIFTRPRLQTWSQRFHRIIGNPPFGDEVSEGDEDLLGTNRLENFEVARGRDKVQSEHVILERAIDMLEPNGKLGLVLPDGLFNNQGELSNCPQVRNFLAKNGHIEAIVSLPDFAFRKSGAQNKTSILFFRKFTEHELVMFNTYFDRIEDETEDSKIGRVYSQAPFDRLKTFLAEATQIGYSPAGSLTIHNDLYRSGATTGSIDDIQDGTILGEWRRFTASPTTYTGSVQPSCMSLSFVDMWQSHSSRRIDPKYHLFKSNETAYTPEGWIRLPIGHVMQRRLQEIIPYLNPEQEFVVMTISQTGEIRKRQAGVGHNPPEWKGMYFENGSSTWFQAQSGDVVYSSIDLWKGCIAVVPEDFDGAIVTKEFPIYEVTDERLNAEFLSYLLRTRFYQRAFRAITTGHSNRRRTQAADFEALEICFPSEISEQLRIIQQIREARALHRQIVIDLKQQMVEFSDLVEGRHLPELPLVDADDEQLE